MYDYFALILIEFSNNFLTYNLLYRLHVMPNILFSGINFRVSRVIIKNIIKNNCILKYSTFYLLLVYLHIYVT